MTTTERSEKNRKQIWDGKMEIKIPWPAPKISQRRNNSLQKSKRVPKKLRQCFVAIPTEISRTEGHVTMEILNKRLTSDHDEDDFRETIRQKFRNSPETVPPKSNQVQKSCGRRVRHWEMGNWLTPLFLCLMLLLLGGTLEVRANHLPQFLLSEGQSEIVLRLKEGPATPPGSLIYTVKGVDRDNDQLTFGLKGRVANELLRVERKGKDAANLYLKKELDREVEDEYMLILTLNDGRLSEPVQQSMLILVEDSNDNSPVFKSYQSTIKVEENSEVPRVLTALQATDIDEGPYGQVIYRLEVEEGDQDIFDLNIEDGKAVVKLLQPLDYESKVLHQLRVVAMDRAESQAQINRAVASLVVQVEDKEDVDPVFTSVPPVTNLREDVPPNTFVLQVRAIDGDRGVNREIVYSLLGEEEQRFFGVDGRTGIIYTRAPLDRETTRGGSFLLKIKATEEGESKPQPSVETTVVVNLLDVNDERPTFRSKSYKAEIAENSQEGVPVRFLGESIPEVFDHDLGLNGTFRLKTEGDGGVFEVTPSEGINQVSFLIRVKNPARIDFERLKEINLTLIAEEVSGGKFQKVPLSVSITDVNDNFPEFEKEVYEVELNENAGPGTRVVRVRASDKDSGLFGTQGIRYTALSGPQASNFVLDRVTGEIRVGKKAAKNSLDRETSPVLYLTVEAQDNMGKGNRNSVQVAIYLRDENDNEPIFLQSKYEARIFENEMDFVSPIQFQARDLDLKDSVNSEIHYSILSGNDGGWLEVNELNGLLTVAKPFDFEALQIQIPMKNRSRIGKKSGWRVGVQEKDENVKQVEFMIRAHDNGIPSKYSVARLTLFVFDQNDNLPTFKRTAVRRTVREDIVGGSKVAEVEAVDLDASSPFNRVFYRIEAGAQDKFMVESETGIIRLAEGAQLDFNLRPFHLLQVIAIDGGGKQSNSPCLVNITVKDVNNKRPRFVFSGENGRDGETSGHLTAKIPENSPPGSIITQLKAVDPDSSALLRYSVNFNKSEAMDEGGRVLSRGVLALEKYLELDPSDGTLRVGKNSLDREIVESIRLQVSVRDEGSETGVQESWTFLSLRVQDRNDNDPKFRENPYLATVPENTPPGAKILTLTADDLDKQRTISYKILTEGKRAKLPVSLDVDSGVVELTAPLDREQADWINFTVVAEDSGTLPQKRRTTVPVHIKVADRNDNVPVFIDGISSVRVKENADVGSVVAVVIAEDADSGTFAKITYLLDRKSSQGKFVVDSETGVISVAEPLDRETQPSYTLVIQAWDNFQFGYGSGDSRNAFKQIAVEVEDINDSPPQFVSDQGEEQDHPHSCVSVTEFHKDVILTARANDLDDPKTPNGQVALRIKSGNDLGLFRMQSGIGVGRILPARSLKGFYGNYTLTLEARDGAPPFNSVSKDFHICVLDYNDNKPRFINPAQNFSIRVPENATVGSSIIQVRAVDSDIGPNGIVRYRFRQEFSRHWETFRINPTTGVLTLAKPLDREQQKVYYLRVEAYDLGQPTPLSSELDLTILVKNVDDFKPMFVNTLFKAKLTENINPGRESVELPPTVDRDDEDEDEEENPHAQVCYFILPDSQNSSELFSVDPLKHVLQTKGRLDREKQPQHNFTVLATENCHQDLTKVNRLSLDPQTLLNVEVTVLDVNDNAPRFTQRTFTGGVSTSSEYGTEILRVDATDADTPQNAQLRYWILPPVTMSLSEGLSHLINNDQPLFSVNGSTGGISLAFDPQPDMKGHFALNLKVNDTTGLQDTAKALIYLLRDDQKVKITVRMSPGEVRSEVGRFKGTLSAVTGAIVNADENFRYHQNKDGSVDKTKTDFFVHLVHPQQNSVLEADEVLRLLDLNIEELDELFKEFNVVNTEQKGLALLSSPAQPKSLFLVYAGGAALFLALLLLVVISLCFAQRSKYQRQLKAATTNAYGSNSSGVLVPRAGNLPNTNVHSVEGSNPIWMQAYHNNWYKEQEDSVSENSESRDSLDENGMGTESTSPPSSHMRSFLGADPPGGPVGEKELGRRNDLNRTYHRNLIYGNRLQATASPQPNCLILKKHLETTEL